MGTLGSSPCSHRPPGEREMRGAAVRGRESGAAARVRGVRWQREGERGGRRKREEGGREVNGLRGLGHLLWTGVSPPGCFRS